MFYTYPDRTALYIAEQTLSRPHSFLGQCCISSLLAAFSWHLVPMMVSNPITLRCHHDVRSPLTCQEYGSIPLLIEYMMQRKKKIKKSKDQKGCFGYQMILFQSACFFLSYRLPLLLQPFAVSLSSLCSVRLQTSIYYKPCTPAVSLSTDVQIPDASKFSLLLLYDP